MGKLGIPSFLISGRVEAILKIVLSFMISNIEKHSRTILENNFIAIAKSVVLDSNVLHKYQPKSEDNQFVAQVNVAKACPTGPNVTEIC